MKKKKRKIEKTNKQTKNKTKKTNKQKTVEHEGDGDRGNNSVIANMLDCSFEVSSNSSRAITFIFGLIPFGNT